MGQTRGLFPTPLVSGGWQGESRIKWDLGYPLSAVHCGNPILPPVEIQPVPSGRNRSLWLCVCWRALFFFSLPVSLYLFTFSAEFLAIWSSPPGCQSRRLAPILCRIVALISPRSILLVVFPPFFLSYYTDGWWEASFCWFSCVPLPYGSYLTFSIAGHQWHSSNSKPILWQTALQDNEEFSPVSSCSLPPPSFPPNLFWTLRAFILNKPELLSALL